MVSTQGTHHGAVGSHRQASVALSKHEAAGNDFFVLLCEGPERRFEPAEVRRICDRDGGARAGAGAEAGADGLIVGSRAPGAGLSMTLYNADGSVAEMSGNGIRCLVQAAVRSGLVEPGTVEVATAAGRRSVVMEGGDGALETGRASVEMGSVQLGDEVQSPLAGCRARLAKVGNPHLVVLGDVDLAAVELEEVAAAVAGIVDSALNVEVVRPGPGKGALTLRVHERGVGETSACGTGSCAAAAVAFFYGVVGTHVRVHNPGGVLDVQLGAAREVAAGGGPPAPATATELDAVLSGPVRHVGDVEFDLEGPRRAGGKGAAR